MFTSGRSRCFKPPGKAGGRRTRVRLCSGVAGERGEGGSDTQQHYTRRASYFLGAFRKLTVRPLQGFSGHAHMFRCYSWLLPLAIALLLSFHKTPPIELRGPFLGFYIYTCAPVAFVDDFTTSIASGSMWIWFLSRPGRTFAFESGYRRRLSSCSPYLL